MRIYGLIGKKLGHSFSARLFNERFEATGTDARYDLWEMPDVSHLPRLIADNPDIAGFNVTVPFKQSVIPLLDSLSEEAEAINAVNCVAVERLDDRILLHGFNTDARGFLDMIPEGALKTSSQALVLGTGGAAQAVAFALKSIGATVRFVSRHRSGYAESYDTLPPDIVRSADVIVNTTPLGMWPDIDSAPPIDYSMISPGCLCLDCVYNPEETRFMRLCAMSGARVASGMKMLIGQARGNARIWGLDIF